ncbi:MAG TPA: thiamine pyrophosphate-binding protein [Geminicoccaceae bacterium]|nr:thiamine pyrophosphate-binding protein [Geminicoccaceae bacterium]
MNRVSGAEACVRMLQLHGVRHIFGLCGDTSLPLYDALYRLDHGITHVLTRDERSAAYMADAYARVTGRVGVCEGPSGGGATYILPGVVEANESSIPVLAITTDIAVESRGRCVLTELDQEALFRPLTKWNRVIDRADQIPGAVRAAFRHMTTGRPGAVHLGLPFDIQKDPVDEAAVHGDPALGAYPARRVAPERAAIEAAAQAILSAARPLFVCGGGPVIAGAEAELRALAELLEAPVATTISGQGSIAEDHPLALGVVGSNGGTPETRTLIDHADLVVFIGCRAGSVTTERWRHPAPGRVRVMHIDVDPAVIGVNYPTEVAVVGDAKLALAALRDEVVRHLDAPLRRPFGRERVARAKAEKFAAFSELARSDAVPIRPERIVATLQELLPSDALVVADAGTPCPYFSAYYELRSAGRHFITNRAHGALGYALPAAIGAHIGRPEAKCVAIMGDGSFGFASGELETIVRLRLPIAIVVVANATFGWIKAGQKSGFAGRYFSVDFTPGQHARIAEAYGIRAWRVEDPVDLRPALAAALETGGPALIDVVTQPLHEAQAPVSEWVA